MPKPKLQMPPFPKLGWDGYSWRGDSRFPFYRSDGGQELCVHMWKTLKELMGDEVEPTSARLPTAAQVAAYARITATDSPLRSVLLPAFRKRIPELATADWDGLVSSFHLSNTSIFLAELDGESYLAYSFHCTRREWGYDISSGVITHQDRLVHFGDVEETWDDKVIRQDLRSRKRT
jgi:hypothetical protein